MSLPPNKADRRWMCRPAHQDEADAKPFHGENFYFAQQRAAAFFHVDPGAIVGTPIEAPTRTERTPSHDPWAWLGADEVPAGGVMNRKQRRAEMANARNKSDDPAEGFDSRLQLAIHQAIQRVVPPGTLPESVPHAEIIRGLGLVAAAFAVQSNVSEAAFANGMASYHRGISEALGIESAPKGPTLELP